MATLREQVQFAKIRASRTAAASAGTVARLYSQMGESFAEAVAYSIAVSVQEAANEAVGQTSENTVNTLTNFAFALDSKVGQGRDARLRTIHTIAAQQAQLAMIRAFQASHGSPSGDVSRRGRFANGFMLRALQNPLMIDARADSVGIINPLVLDSTARQWYRLNFGARPRSTPRPGSYTIRFFEEVAGELTLRRFQPSGPFNMPSGIILNGQFFLQSDLGAERIIGDRIGQGGRNALTGSSAIGFHPGARPTAGIRGTNFLDAGVESLAHNLGQGWTQLWREWLLEASNEARGPATEAGVTSEDAGAAVSQITNRATRFGRKVQGELIKHVNLRRSTFV